MPIGLSLLPSFPVAAIYLVFAFVNQPSTSPY